MNYIGGLVAAWTTTNFRILNKTNKQLPTSNVNYKWLIYWLIICLIGFVCLFIWG